jgi:hypothetical protein
MATITRSAAVSRMSAEIETFNRDDLVEVYNELFPETPRTADDADDLITGIRKHIQSGLADEEIADLWNVVFPKDRNVWYDGENQSLHVNEEPEFVDSAD